jgi:hypothetical protein|tara:strand:+ start:103 stop:282 length:180 start_codon:yes stop_codon:yes gene_type:complete
VADMLETWLETFFIFIGHTFWSGQLQTFTGIQVILLLLVTAFIIGVVRAILEVIYSELT